MSQIECQHCKKPFNSSMRRCPFCGGEKKRMVHNTTPVCPRCQVKMVNHKFRATDLDICPNCQGFWTDTVKFKKLTSQREVFGDENIPYEYQRPPLAQEKAYLPCARCGSLMTRSNFRRISGVLIDICHDHGVWLDAGELEQIRVFIANGGLDESQDQDIANNKLEIERVAGQVKDIQSMQNILHYWDIKRWIWKNR
jgi:Zn-finger nucleic acid-binding protein